MILIDPRSSKPIYEQIIEQMKENIMKGILKPGDKLPSVRELAAMITTNPNTVSKAYQELERQKAIETIRGRGTFVAMNYTSKINEDNLEDLKSQIKKVIVEAHYMGMDKTNVINLIESVYEDFK